MVMVKDCMVTGVQWGMKTTTKRFTLRYITGELSHPMSFDTYREAFKCFQRACAISTERCDMLLCEEGATVAVFKSTTRQWMMVRDMIKSPNF